MIELNRDRLSFSFEEVHPRAQLGIDFKRTLRIPDDGRDYPLPAALGRFPLRHVDDFASTVPAQWVEQGGVMLPMYQAEAMWVNFSGRYPFAVKLATGKINAVTGEPWRDGLNTDPQDYLIAPKQPWLDGYCVEKGVIRQFVAMPLGAGYSAEEQLTGEARFGGLQIIAYPMKRDVFERYEKRRRGRSGRYRARGSSRLGSMMRLAPESSEPDMGLAPGGRMRQELYEDSFGLDVWDMRHCSRCFVHIANSVTWQAITGNAPPLEPLSARDYERAGIPWFEYYDEGDVLSAPGALSGLKSVIGMGKQKRENPIASNPSMTPLDVVKLRGGLRRDQVREGVF